MVNQKPKVYEIPLIIDLGELIGEAAHSCSHGCQTGT